MSNLAKALKENSNLITKRIVALCKMRLLSPALIGSGEDENTDRDVYLDVNQSPIISGTSLAGVLRSAMDEKDAAILFGPQINKPGDESAISQLWVLDAPALVEEKDKNGVLPAKVIIIDNVALEENKVAKPGAKFDFEAIERDSYFHLRLQLIVRKNSHENTEALFEELLPKLNTLYIGGKTSRGFGKLQCESVYKKVFENNNTGLKDWKKFNWDEWILYVQAEKCDNSELLSYKPEHISLISAELNLKGTLLIRDDYSVTGDEDSAHITSAGKSVIYGTSWAGAMKNGLARFIDTNNCKNYLDEVFGYIDGKTKPKQHYPSKVRVDASYFENESRHPVMRVKIDRWTGGTVNGALFTVCPQFGGKVTLTIHYPKDDCAIKQLFILALQAIDLGIITIGGETAIGRGVFTVEKICIDGTKQNKCDLFSQPKKTLADAIEAKGGAVNG